MAKVRIRPYKPGKYGKGMIASERHPQAALWRVKGWHGTPRHGDMQEMLGLPAASTIDFHVDKRRRFYFHEHGDHVSPKDPATLARAVTSEHPGLRWGRMSVEDYERPRGLSQPSSLAMANRPLRAFEQGAHLHVLDWAHDTARYRFQAAGAVQVKAAARAFVDSGIHGSTNPGAPELPSLEAAITAELRKLYALGHATVRSELEHQAHGHALPIGLSAAPEPPNLRRAKAKQGKAANCASCKMFDSGTCWGYGNWPVKPNELCDSYAADPKVKTLALSDARRDPGALRARARLVASSVAHHIWQAVHRGRLQGITDPRALRQLGREAGNGALKTAAGHHAGGAISAGRHAAALSLASTGQGDGTPKARIIGARYTSVLDKSTCGPCAEADTGELVALSSPEWIPTPNPACLGGDRCRCIHVYQLSTEVGDQAQAIAAGGLGGL